MKTRWLTVLLLGAMLLAVLGGLNARPQAATAGISASQQGLHPPPVVIYADPTFRGRRYTPPAQSFRHNAPHSATITVNFVGAWPAQAQAAFLFAAGVWETQITSAVPIVVQAQWAALSASVLGAASPADYYRDFSGASHSNTWYPIALANKLSNTDLNGISPEITATFNSAFPDWYFGTDGNTPINKWDFASVVLHELGHGLGFIGSMNVDNGNSGDGTECNNVNGAGCWGYGSGLPFIYDQFTQNGSGTPLLSYPNNSSTLGAQLTSNNLFFDGPFADSANGNAPVSLYAPAQWQSGSSYSHLGESFNGTPNSLMTYALPPGEANHDPGPVVRGMFGDMGWSINNATPTATLTPPATATPTLTPTLTSTPTPAPTFTPTPKPGSSGAYLPLVLHEYALIPPTPTPLPSDWLGYLNGLRAIGGLPALAENSAWSNGCTLHARYMVKTDTVSASEDPGSPWYSAEGDAAAGNSNLLVSSNTGTTDVGALSGWMSAPFHGLSMLSPDLQSTGFGSYREAIGQWQMGACLDILRGLGTSSLTYPIAWPADGEYTPLATSTIQESPDPLSACSGYTRPTGAPVYLLFGPGWSISPAVTASSFAQGSTALAHCLLTSSTYTNPDPDMQQLGRDLLAAHDAVVLIPKEPLIPGATYNVSLTVDGQVYAWQFTVRAAALRHNLPAEAQIR